MCVFSVFTGASPRGTAKTEGQIRAVLRKRLIIFTVAGYFCMLLFDWLGITVADGGIPSTWGEASLQIGVAAVETAIFTLLFYLVVKYCLERFYPHRDDGVSARHHESVRNRQG